jgi:hypothetical protein
MNHERVRGSIPPVYNRKQMNLSAAGWLAAAAAAAAAAAVRSVSW